MEFKTFIPTFNNIPIEPIIFKYRFTVFTPMYNCEKTIERVHESLKKQSFKDFEWLIINDGSTDTTHEVISSIIKDSSLTIHYVNNKNNRHKMACFMQAIEIAEGEFLLTFDADDECVPNALEIFNREYLEIPEETKPSVAALTCLCIDQYGNKIGDDFPTDPFYSTPFELEAISKIKGEKWGFTKTVILRHIVYPKEFMSNNGYIPESLVWNLIGKEGYQTKFFNEVLRIYHQDIGNSISSGGIKRSITGSASNYIANFNWFFKDYFFSTPIFFLKNLYLLLRLSKFADFDLKNYTRSIDSTFIKFFFIILWPIRKFLK